MLLSDRNLFVHHLAAQEWFTLSTVSGRDRAMDFLGPLATKAHPLNGLRGLS